MPTYREALEKLMDDPKKAAAWKKKHGDLTLSNFTKVSKEFNRSKPKKSVSNIKPASTTTGKIVKASLNQSAKKASDELKNKGTGSTVESEKPTSKNQKKTVRNIARLVKISKRKKNKEARLNRRADRIAARRGFKGSGKFLTNPDGTVVPDNEGLMAARKEARELMTARAGRRKQFLRDFATQLAKGEQAGRTKTEYKGDYKEGDNFGQKGGSKEEVQQNNEVTENTKQNIEKLNTTSKDNDFANTYLGSTGFNYTPPSFGEMPELPNLTKDSSLAKIEEDSTPLMAMRKAYNKKRGF